MAYIPDCADCSTVDPVAPVIPPVYDPPGGECCVPKGGAPGQVLTKRSGTDLDMIWADGGGGGGSLLSPIKATKTVGGVNANDTIPAGTSYEDVFRMILAPSLNPTLTPPSATLTTNAALLREKGEVLQAGFTIAFNRGKIDPAYTTDGYRSGPATGYTLNGRTQSTGNFQSVEISEANKTFSGSVAYSAGQQPKDSSGADYDRPLPAGNASTNTITFEFVEALYATTVNITTATKQPLVSKSAREYIFQMCMQTDDEGNFFDVPASWNITSITTWNPITSLWNNVDFEFDATDVTHEDAGGNTIAYKRYTDNRHAGAVGRRIKITWGA